MNNGTRILVLCALILTFPMLIGTEACREDYELAARSATTDAATPTPDDDDDSVVSEPTIAATQTAAVEATQTEVAVIEATQTANVSASTTPESITDLSPVGSVTTSTSVRAVALPIPTPTVAPQTMRDVFQDVQNSASQTASQWLGTAFLEDEEINETFKDTDNDGFSDGLELHYGSDVSSSESTPSFRVATSFFQRFTQIDVDVDGLTDEQEAQLGTEVRSKDTDRDGCADGLEVLSGTDPGDRGSRPEGADGDCLSDEVEQQFDTNSSSPDTDRDGASDGMEIIIGSNPLDPDTDRDGMADGKEIELGSDPIVDDRVLSKE